MADKQLLTHSRLACFRTCPRKHHLRYELGIVPVEESLALRVGSAFHAAVEAVDHGLDPAPIIDAQLQNDFDAALVAAMLNAHMARYADQPLEVVVTEQEFRLALVNPETGGTSPLWLKAGKLDLIVRLPDGRLALQEYKTTSRDFAPSADYWLQLHMDSQLSIYLIAAREMGYAIDTILYDVTRRPGLRPFKATPPEIRKYTKAGDLYANQRERDETPEEFAARVATDIADRPEHYFARIEIARLDQDLLDCAYEMWQQQLAIRTAQRTGHWYRNPGACIGNTYVCEYLPICQNRDLADRIPGGYKKADSIHPELAGNTSSVG